MLRTADSRTQAQRYADDQWWMIPGVKVVGYAIHHLKFDLSTRSVYSVELLYLDGSLTRWICVSTETDGSGHIYECTNADESFLDRKSVV